jgi:hypothetical protein
MRAGAYLTKAEWEIAAIFDLGSDNIAVNVLK